MEPTPHGRMTRVVAFELPISTEGMAHLLELESKGSIPDELPSSSVEPQLVETIENELVDHKYRLFSADSGRGASGPAVALEILSIVADIGGTIAFMAGTYAVVRRLYDALTKKLGRRPRISLGTATLLAAAHLSDQFDNLDFRLHGAGDTRIQPYDYAYTGNDCFYVIFERDLERYHCI
jgi:hypothetical protein